MVCCGHPHKEKTETMKNKTRLWFSILLVLSLGVFALSVVTAQDDDEEATEEATEEMAAATEEATTEMTEEAMLAATEEATEEAATEEATEEAATEEVTEEATEGVTPPAVPTSSVANEYVIQPGDTLFSIANRFGVSVTDLAEANDIVNPSRIFWGLTLQIPTGGDDDDDAADTGGPTATEEATPTSAPDDDDATLETYTVRTGDNLYRISLRYGTTIARLVELNPVITNENVIFVGQEILVPAS